jgi:hypothetical protein
MAVGKTFLLDSWPASIRDENFVTIDSPTLSQVRAFELNENEIETRANNISDARRGAWTVGVVLCFSLHDNGRSLDALLDCFVPQMRAHNMMQSTTPMYLLGLLDPARPRNVADAAVDQTQRWLGAVGASLISLNVSPDQLASTVDFDVFKRFRSLFKKRIVPKPIPPPRPAAPRIVVPPSTSESPLHVDLRPLLTDGTFSDVVLVVGGETGGGARLRAHRVVLCIGSKLWRAVFGVSSSQEQGAYDSIVAGVSESKTKDGCVELTVALTANVSLALVREMLDAIYGDRTPSSECIAMFRLTELTDDAKCRWIEQHVLARALFADATIVADDEHEFRTQRVLLHARCGFFERLLSGPFVEAQPNAGVVHLQLSDVEVAVVEQCVRYLLVRHVDITSENATQLLALAQRLQLPRLVALCEDFLARCIEESIESVDLLELLAFADDTGAKQLHAAVMRSIAINFAKLRATKRLKGRQLIQLSSIEWPPSEFQLELEAWESDKRGMISNVLHSIGFTGESAEHPLWGYAHVKSKPVAL